ncbi:PhzF family phenazine biosynthesis isomerase [Pusillimonas sp. TS35]|uniref:PhzF family phenazine biosynthesis protein n=1 Tax=Paracandidimonas lactea TaxID=2895524 RepID=UPI00136FC133|nr:PhzF family phenazine biosynthesis protein [Paracandidimonas lactea]MYN14519.1 PhzF family phenazine biosynthesis isomerase [Pusillimonas sp. TS35]
MPTVPFKQVDVFTHMPFSGNPVAVILGTDGLDSVRMQQIARWTNLSETTFVIPPADPKADYGVRIFSPGGELPFAGHPTIGTAHALLEAGLVTEHDGILVQQSAIGLVALSIRRRHGGRRVIAFDLPAASFTSLGLEHISQLDAALGNAVQRTPAPRIVNVGPRWLVARLDTAADVLACRPDFRAIDALCVAVGASGVTLFGDYPPGARVHIEVRSFAPGQGVNEDPVCGSGNGCVGAFIHTTGLRHYGNAIIASQGAALERNGHIEIDIDGSTIRVGGSAVTCIDGHINTA